MFGVMASVFDTQTVIKIFFDPVFALEDDDCFTLLSPFVNIYICVSILDSPTIPDNYIEILQLCLERILIDPAFNLASYRAGELHGWELPSLTRSLLFVAVEHADLASRFANGEWSEIGVILPIVDRFVRAAGWSAAVMSGSCTCVTPSSVASTVSQWLSTAFRRARFCISAPACTNAKAQARYLPGGTLILDRPCWLSPIFCWN